MSGQGKKTKAPTTAAEAESEKQATEAHQAEESEKAVKSILSKILKIKEGSKTAIKDITDSESFKPKIRDALEKKKAASVEVEKATKEAEQASEKAQAAATLSVRAAESGEAEAAARRAARATEAAGEANAAQSKVVSATETMEKAISEVTKTLEDAKKKTQKAVTSVKSLTKDVSRFYESSPTWLRGSSLKFLRVVQKIESELSDEYDLSSDLRKKLDEIDPVVKKAREEAAELRAQARQRNWEAVKSTAKSIGTLVGTIAKKTGSTAESMIDSTLVSFGEAVDATTRATGSVISSLKEATQRTPPLQVSRSEPESSSQSRVEMLKNAPLEKPESSSNPPRKIKMDGGARTVGGGPAEDLTAAIDEIVNTVTTYEGPTESQLQKEDIFRQLRKELAGGPNASDVTVWVKTYLYQLFLYLPNALVLFGPIIDIINEEVRYSLASIIGIASIVFNKLVGLLLTPLLKASSLDTQEKIRNCFIPGFDFLESRVSPQGIVLPAAIFTYLLIDLGLHRSPSQNFGTGALMVSLVLFQAFVLYTNGCFRYYVWSSPFVTLLVALIVGAICGLFGWIGVRFVAPQRLPSAAGSISPASSTQKSGNPLGTSSGVSDVATCSPPNDQDQFVCEAYKDGEVVTSTIVS